MWYCLFLPDRPSVYPFVCLSVCLESHMIANKGRPRAKTALYAVHLEMVAVVFNQKTDPVSCFFSLNDFTFPL